MTPLPSRLAFRLYITSLAQLLVIVAASLVIHRLTLGPPPARPPHWQPMPGEGPPPEGAPPEARPDVSAEARPGASGPYGPNGPPPGMRPRPPRREGMPPPVSLAAWGIAIALVVAGVASVMLARSFASPLTQLASAARELGKGNLSVRVKLKRNDELGALADAFDDMADRLSQLLRSQQELLANVSHELRTPLARITVALDLAAEGDAAMAREALDEIAEDVAELERLVGDVLRMARLDLAEGRAGPAVPPVRPEHVDPRALLEKAVVRFRQTHPDRAVELLIEGELPAVSGDPVLLRRVIDNLLDNARKYSEASIVLRARYFGEKVVMAVEDRGIGIAPEDIAHIATPFFRTDRSRARKTGGLGLGLSLARRIAEAHGGTLTVESEVGVGTKVRIELPPRGAPMAPKSSAFGIS